jgi:TRAP-type C4-dicarboxylate transport system substrate-binding protein
MHDRVLADVAQIGYSILGQLASQYPRAQVSGLPFLSDDTGASSVALWRIYQRGLLGPDFEKVKVLALFNSPAAYLHTNKPVKTLEDIQGMKLAVSSRVAADVMVALGASPVTLVTTEFYEGLQRGVADGAVAAWTAVKTFKLDEVTKHHLEVPLGEAPAFVFMNKTAYASLPPHAKKAIDEYSDEALSKILGTNNAAQGREESKVVAAKPGHVVEKLPPPEYAKWKERIAPIIAAWTGQTPDGAKVLAAYREELQKLGMTN